MKILDNVTNKTSFNGIKISKTHLLGNDIEIYRLTHKDKEFINHLKTQINLKQLLPNLDKDSLEIHNSILSKSLEQTLSPQKTALLLTCNKKPSGIFISSNNNNKTLINYVCTWPYEVNKKTPFGSKILFEQAFKDFLDSSSNIIEIHAIRFGSAISKYIQLGFKSCGGDNYTEIMRSSRARVEDFYNKLKKQFNLIPTKNNFDIDLMKELF